MKNTISNNSDFLFLYEAIQCNPNGDPDEENKPRMDKDTSTNLVTDVRVKRYIRDYLKQEGTDIFVDMEGDKKVSPDTRLIEVVKRMYADPQTVKAIFQDDVQLVTLFEELTKGKTPDEIVKKLQDEKDKKFYPLNNPLLTWLVSDKYADIRLFGSAFAVKGFTKTFTGPVQLNWGYSLHPVKIIESDSIVTIMNDDASTFGKDYRVHYSLLAFHGSINKHAAKSTGMTDDDLELFRKAIWDSIPANPTRSKLNQYPKLYVEIVYNDGFTNGQFGDLRQHISAKAKKEAIRGFNDLDLDLSKLAALIKENKGEGKPVNDAIIKTAAGIEFKIS